MATTKKTTAKRAKPKENPLAVYLTIAHEGDANAATNGQFWIASLTEGGRATSLYAKSREEIEERAREILAARSVVV